MSKERDQEYLKALRRADRALKNLWKKCEVGSRVFNECSHMQCVYLHEEIRKVEQRLRGYSTATVQPMPVAKAEAK